MPLLKAPVIRRRSIANKDIFRAGKITQKTALAKVVLQQIFPCYS